MKSNKEIWFVTGSQMLYGDDVLKEVAKNSGVMVDYINSKADYKVVYKCTVKSSDEIVDIIKEANYSKECIGIVTWMHTFSPSKMWINGLNLLQKPVLHLHTQFNKEIPWNEIDMNFMNTNQSAHGDREHGYINTRMGITRKVVVGHYTSEKVISEMNKWFNVAYAVDYSKNLKVARFGDNMRDVAVTEGDKVFAQMKLGWSVNTHPVGDLKKYVDNVSNEEIEKIYAEYLDKYEISEETLKDSEKVDSIKYQGKLEIAMEKFLTEGGFGAYTNTFEDLHGLDQLPGLASQRLMEKGFGFGPEGDWKVSAMINIIKAMGGNKGTSLMEDYTYDMPDGDEKILGAHMLEICPTISENKPEIQVHPLGIGGKDAPARMVFTGREGKGVCVSLVDLGGRLRLIVLDVDAVKSEKKMPNLPVASVFWKPMPNFEIGCKAWIYAGGAHHSVFSYDVDATDLYDFAEIMGLEFVHIHKDTCLTSFKKELEINDLIYSLKN
ncbi:MAG: L-arabinose isomerase [Lachnospirales bacterium]